MKEYFAGKTAIITGSATGLGAGVASGMAVYGANLAINYSKSKKEAEETAKACRKAGAADVVCVQADVSQDADCRKLADAAIKKWGGVDILVNNAGVTKFAALGDLDALTAEDFLHIYRTNVVSAFQMTRAVAPSMKERGRGAVVNVSSIAGIRGIGSSVAYAASKGALNTMTYSLAMGLAPEIRVNAVCPGFIGTRWFRDRFGEEGYAGLVKMQEKTTPLQQAGTPELVAKAVLFFAGPGADNITGETLLSDAGMHLGPNPFAAR